MKAEWNKRPKNPAICRAICRPRTVGGGKKRYFPAEADPRNAAGMMKTAKAGLRRIMRRRTPSFDQWFPAYRFASQLSLAELRSKSQPPASGRPSVGIELTEFRAWLPPGDRFWADPFPAVHEGRYYLFFEEFPSSTRRGRIVASELLADGSWSLPRIVIECSYHLSYPHVFRWNSDWYMLPETRTNQTIELWRATNFPWAWTPDCRLTTNIWASDSTIAEIDGRFWMFTCVSSVDAAPCEHLLLFHADSPRGPWIAHRKNPVLSDARCARAAGRLFQQNGKWVRPGQDCSMSYGRRITFREIVRLNPDEYDEREISAIEPDWAPGLTATHTFNAVAGLAVIDGCRRAQAA
jgi:hypothetical protein